MGLTGLESLDDFIEVNRRNYRAYKLALRDIPGLRMVEYDESELCNRQYIIVEVDEGRCGRTRDELIQTLHAENVLARKYFWPGCHRMEPYKTLYPDADRVLPCTDEVAAKVLVLPTGTAVDEQSIDVICSILRHAVMQ